MDISVRDVATDPESFASVVEAEFDAGDEDGVADVVDEGDLDAGLECDGESEEKSEAKENVRDVGVGRVRGVADAIECSGRARRTRFMRGDMLCLVEMASRAGILMVVVGDTR